MIAILGATGQIGGMVARNLLKKGEQVRAIVRDAEKVKALREMCAELLDADYMSQGKAAYCPHFSRRIWNCQ